MKVAQSCPTLCDPLDYTVHGILQARILEHFPSPGDLPNPLGSNPGLPHCRRIPYQLSHKGSPHPCLGFTKKKQAGAQCWAYGSHSLPTRTSTWIWPLTRKRHTCRVSGQAPHEEPSCSSANPLVAHVAHSEHGRCGIQRLGRTWTSDTRPWSVSREEGRGWRLRAEEQG